VELQAIGRLHPRAVYPNLTLTQNRIDLLLRYTLQGAHQIVINALPHIVEVLNVNESDTQRLKLKKEKIKGLKGLAITVNIRPSFRESLLYRFL
jgi:hypothetical protein